MLQTRPDDEFVGRELEVLSGLQDDLVVLLFVRLTLVNRGFDGLPSVRLVRSPVFRNQKLVSKPQVHRMRLKLEAVNCGREANGAVSKLS